MAAANEKLAVNLTSSSAAVTAAAAPLSKAAPAMNAAFGGDAVQMAPAGVSAGLMGAPLNVNASRVPMPPPSAFGAEPTPNAASGDPFAKFGGAVSTGTTIMAVAFDGGVVIAADSRTSTGDYVSNRVSDKLTKIHDRIYCARSGSAADTQAISDIVNYYLDLHAVELDTLPRVETAAHLFQNIIYQNKNALMAGIIVAGWDKKDGGSVWSITLGGTCVKQPFAIGGSGSAYIYGLCDAEWKKFHGADDGKEAKEQKKMTREQCEEFVQRAVSHAMARDGSSGGVIRMCTITKDGCDRKFTAGDKLAFQAEWMK